MIGENRKEFIKALTVAELIEVLKIMPQDAEIRYLCETEACEIHAVEFDEGKVWFDKSIMFYDKAVR